MAEELKRTAGLCGYIEYPYAWAYQNMLFGSTTRMSAVKGINSTDTPVMIIHGTRDESIYYNGASFISHRKEITNLNVIYKTCSTENHNGHKSLYRSDASIKYSNELNKEYKKLYDRYNGKIPDNVNAEFYISIDKFKKSERDADFMNEINSFYEDQLYKQLS